MTLYRYQLKVYAHIRIVANISIAISQRLQNIINVTQDLSGIFLVSLRPPDTQAP